jgi:hypothetical protein
MSTFAFDPTGVLAANAVVNELLAVPSLNSGYKVVYPTAGPFYAEGNTVTLIKPDNSTQILIYGTDYYAAYEFAKASLATGKKVALGYVILNHALVGSIRIASYQAFGSDWSPVSLGISNSLLLANQVDSPMIDTYESKYITGPIVLPAFPDFLNNQTNIDQTDIKAVNTSLTSIVTKLASANVSRNLTAGLGTPNPSQFGLDQIPNLPTASVAEHLVGQSGKVATVEGVKALFNTISSADGLKAAVSNLAENKVGNIVYTAGTLSSPDYIPATGGQYLSSSYTELAGVLGSTTVANPNPYGSTLLSTRFNRGVFGIVKNEFDIIPYQMKISNDNKLFVYSYKDNFVAWKDLTISGQSDTIYKYHFADYKQISTGTVIVDAYKFPTEIEIETGNRLDSNIQYVPQYPNIAPVHGFGVLKTDGTYLFLKEGNIGNDANLCPVIKITFLNGYELELAEPIDYGTVVSSIAQYKNQYGTGQENEFSLEYLGYGYWQFYDYSMANTCFVRSYVYENKNGVETYHEGILAHYYNFKDTNGNVIHSIYGASSPAGYEGQDPTTGLFYCNGSVIPSLKLAYGKQGTSKVSVNYPFVTKGINTEEPNKVIQLVQENFDYQLGGISTNTSAHFFVIHDLVNAKTQSSAGTANQTTSIVSKPFSLDSGFHPRAGKLHFDNNTHVYCPGAITTSTVFPNPIGFNFNSGFNNELSKLAYLKVPSNTGTVVVSDTYVSNVRHALFMPNVNKWIVFSDAAKGSMGSSSESGSSLGYFKCNISTTSDPTFLASGVKRFADMTSWPNNNVYTVNVRYINNILIACFKSTSASNMDGFYTYSTDQGNTWTKVTGNGGMMEDVAFINNKYVFLQGTQLIISDSATPATFTTTISLTSGSPWEVYSRLYVKGNTLIIGTDYSDFTGEMGSDGSGSNGFFNKTSKYYFSTNIGSGNTVTFYNPGNNFIPTAGSGISSITNLQSKQLVVGPTGDMFILNNTSVTDTNRQVEVYGSVSSIGNVSVFNAPTAKAIPGLNSYIRAKPYTV